MRTGRTFLPALAGLGVLVLAVQGPASAAPSSSSHVMRDDVLKLVLTPPVTGTSANVFVNDVFKKVVPGNGLFKVWVPAKWLLENDSFTKALTSFTGVSDENVSYKVVRKTVWTKKVVGYRTVKKTVWTSWKKVAMKDWGRDWKWDAKKKWGKKWWKMAKRHFKPYAGKKVVIVKKPIFHRKKVKTGVIKAIKFEVARNFFFTSERDFQVCGTDFVTDACSNLKLVAASQS